MEILCINFLEKLNNEEYRYKNSMNGYPWYRLEHSIFMQYDWFVPKESKKFIKDARQEYLVDICHYKIYMNLIQCINMYVSYNTKIWNRNKFLGESMPNPRSGDQLRVKPTL